MSGGWEVNLSWKQILDAHNLWSRFNMRRKLPLSDTKTRFQIYIAHAQSLAGMKEFLSRIVNVAVIANDVNQFFPSLQRETQFFS